MCLKFPIDQNEWVFAPPVWQTDGIQSTYMYKKKSNAKQTIAKSKFEEYWTYLL